MNNEMIIRTDKLCFSFGKEKALTDVSLNVEKGAIYGFLGPNGAGKTTTIRLLLGLLEGQRQQPLVFGEMIRENRMHILSRIGSLIEQPSVYEHLSGFENLMITARYRLLGKQRVYEVLEMVKLTTQAKKKVGAYSLGMKQRLGLAMALMGKPDLLILDEPVNGLDPMGIVETRELLMHLNQAYGTTVFLSSHLLSEIEKMVSHVGIINHGNMVFQGTIADFKLLSGKKDFEETFIDLIRN
jgi:ABC-type multidrug transport system ATPase subunit